MAKLLLIEDDALISKMLLLRLQMDGHDIDCARDGKQGMDMALAGEYDALLMDMHMPVMDGHLATRSLRKEGYKGLIIAVTASVMTQDTESALDAGCNYFISKPIGEDFEALVNGYLAEHNAEK